MIFKSGAEDDAAELDSAVTVSCLQDHNASGLPPFVPALTTADSQHFLWQSGAETPGKLAREEFI